MKGREHAGMASLAQTRDQLVKLKTSVKNKINNLVSAREVNLKKEALSSVKGLQEILKFRFVVLVDLELHAEKPLGLGRLSQRRVGSWIKPIEKSDA